MRWTFKPNEFDIIQSFRPTFYFQKTYYTFGLDSSDITIITQWLASKRQESKLTINSKIWLNSYEIYSRLLNLIGFKNYNANCNLALDIFSCSNLIQQYSLSIEQVKTQLLNYALIAINSDLELSLAELIFHAFTIYSLDKSKLTDKQLLLYNTFNCITKLDSDHREIFFHCFDLIKKLISESNDYSDFVFYTSHRDNLTKSFSTWNSLFNNFNAVSLQQDIFDSINLFIPIEILYWITGRNPIPFEDDKKDDSLDFDFNKHEAKQKYLKLIKQYHPDLNPDNIEYCTQKTAEINAAWEEYQLNH